MTRGKALSFFDSFEDVKIIDQIYDDFESQICKNCKHSYVGEETWNGDIVAYCCKLNIGTFTVTDIPHSAPDFGCIKFQAKTEPEDT